MIEIDIDRKELLKLFGIAQDVANIGYWEWDILTNEVIWSARKIEIYGEDSDSFDPSFEKFIYVIDEETKKDVLKEIESVLSEKKEFYDLKHKIRLKSGKRAWVHEKGFVIKDASGIPVKMVGIVYDITDRMVMLEELKNAEARSDFLKTHDPLTSLNNKESLLGDVEMMVSSGCSFCVVFLDIDNFKTINNTFGHRFGDEVIKRVGTIFEEALGKCSVYRYGGDEFVILVNEDDISVYELVEKVERLFDRNITVSGKSLMLTVSMGICCYPKNAESGKDLIKNANSALALAKSSGKKRVLFYESYMSDHISKKRSILDSLSSAISEEAFVVFYQPKVDSISGEIVGFEALVRWRNDKGELLSPALFLPIAQEYGMMGRIDLIVLQKALDQLSKWHSLGFEISLSVNFNITDFEDSKILDFLKSSELLSFVTVEITESELMLCSDKELELIDDLKRLGLKISLDDFGTGYSSLRYIHKLPIDEIKIDRAFVENIPGDGKDEALVTIIKSIVDTFRLHCVVEGVERMEQKEFFQRLGLSTIQGFFYGRPMDAADATALLLKAPFRR